jgi:acyl-CoA synthetase (AMP-forming)/AMP-acid ligase II
MESLDAMLEAASEQNPDTTGNISSEDLLAIIYTAGNSGPRKAVPVLHKRWLITGHQACLYGEIIPGRVIYTVLPLYFNNVFNICFASTLLAGACMVLKKKFSVSRFWQDIRSHGVTHFMAVGEMCDYIYSQPEKPEDSDNPLRYLLSNALPPELAAAFKSRYAIEHVIEIYSTTEGVGSFVNIDEIPGMCGRLTANGIRQGEVAKYDFAQGRLAADDNHRLIKCQPGEIGILLCEINELYDFTGYINDWEATREKIMHSVFQDGDRYYRTDDLVKLHPDDYFAFIDRLGETYRWMGETVSANDVADVIGKFFGGIDEVLVFGVRIPGYTGGAVWPQSEFCPEKAWIGKASPNTLITVCLSIPGPILYGVSAR